jgi:hypothetical protein
LECSPGPTEGEPSLGTFNDIKEGEEITISYLDGSESHTARQTEPGERQQSDQRLAEINRLDRLIGDGTGIVSMPLAYLHDAHALSRLLGVILPRNEQLLIATRKYYRPSTLLVRCHSTGRYQLNP